MNECEPLVRGISGGQKRRVTLARGLVGGAQIVFADEPTSGRDLHSSKPLLNLSRFLSLTPAKHSTTWDRKCSR